MTSPYPPYPQDESGGYGQPPYPPQEGWIPSQRSYLQGGPVGFGEAISQGFQHTTTFKGRASRSAYWWFFLFVFIMGVIGAIIGKAVHVTAIQYFVSGFFALASISLAVRRLHDSGKSGYWYFLVLIPFVGAIALIVVYCLPGTPGPNKYDIQA